VIFSRSRRLVAAILILLAAGLLVGAGRLVVREDPLARADAIYVLGGSWARRPVEAVDLYREGYAPLIVLSPEARDSGEIALLERGTPIPRASVIMRQLMIDDLKVPAKDLEILPGDLDNTQQEADAIAAVAAARNWHTLIVITDRPSTRRAGFAMRRAMGDRVRIIMRSPRTDWFDPSRWWDTRGTFRATFYEVPKLFAYWLGLKG
jgi:uncharacterized SAM-binding protein YcdF (DUF218 family)